MSNRPLPSSEGADGGRSPDRAEPGSHSAWRDEELNLSELLVARGLGQWESLLLDLFDRYAGWLSDYWCDERFDFDPWPAADTIAALVALPDREDGRDEVFAAVLSQADFCFRQARDAQSGDHWDPLQVRYRHFMATGRSEPFWAHVTPWTTEQFVAWALGRLEAARPGPAGV